MLYTVVHEGYDVDVYRSQRALAERIVPDVLHLSDEPGSTNWKYRIERQDHIFK